MKTISETFPIVTNPEYEQDRLVALDCLALFPILSRIIIGRVYPKRGGSRMGSLSGIFRSTPPIGLNRL